MDLSSIFNRLTLAGDDNNFDMQDGNISTVSVRIPASDSLRSASASVSIRADEDGTQTEAVVSVAGDDGLGAVSSATTSTGGDEASTTVIMEIHKTADTVQAMTDVDVNAAGDDAEAAVETKTEITDDGEKVLSLNGEATSGGDAASASVDTAAAAGGDEETSVVGEVQSNATVPAENFTSLNTGATYVIGPNFRIVDEIEETMKGEENGILFSRSVAAVEAEEIDVVESEPHFWTYFDTPFLYDLG